MWCPRQTCAPLLAQPLVGNAKHLNLSRNIHPITRKQNWGRHPFSDQTEKVSTHTSCWLHSHKLAATLPCFQIVSVRSQSRCFAFLWYRHRHAHGCGDIYWSQLASWHTLTGPLFSIIVASSQGCWLNNPSTPACVHNASSTFSAFKGKEKNDWIGQLTFHAENGMLICLCFPGPKA